MGRRAPTDHSTKREEMLPVDVNSCAGFPFEGMDANVPHEEDSQIIYSIHCRVGVGHSTLSPYLELALRLSQKFSKLYVKDSESESDTHSDTSTLQYAHEPFVDFAPKTTKLLKTLFPNCGDVELERMKGGHDNRIVGAKLSSGESLVVRIPRFARDSSEAVLDQVALLRYLTSLKTFLVPQVLQFDETNTNALGSAYMIQPRLDGQSLYFIFDSLSHKQRMELTKEVAQVLAHICNIKFGFIGTLCASPTNRVDSLEVKRPWGSTQTTPYSDTLEYLLESFKGNSQDDHWRTKLFDKLTMAARVLNGKRPFTNAFCLLHADFFARNIFVKEGENGELRIVAILDWDEAMAAPIEAACVVPHWLWTWTPEDIDGVEELADEAPNTSELCEIKELFEKEIEERVPGFISMWKNGWHVRQMLYFAVHGYQGMDEHLTIQRVYAEIVGEDDDSSSSSDSSSDSS